MEERTRRVEVAYLQDLDELERVKAEDFITMAKVATERQWHDTLAGQASVIAGAPRADVSYVGADQQEHAMQSNDTHDGGSSDVEG